jgi:hypothetical protein
MATFQLTDLFTSLDCVVFSRNMEQLRSKLRDGEIVVVDGRLDHAEGSVRLIVNAIYDLDEAAVRPPAKARRNGFTGNGRSNGKSSASTAEDEARPPRPVAGDGAGRRVTIIVEKTDNRAADLERVVAAYACILRYPGGDEAEILIRNGKRDRVIPLPDRSVGYSAGLERDLLALGSGMVVRLAGVESRR